MTDAPLGLSEVGQVIASRYRVEQVLGRGGMGAVYRVRDTRSNRSLALKRGFARDPRKLEARSALLEREYHTLAQLAHPRIIEVYDCGRDEHGAYYTMELLDGTDLNEQGRLPWREACAVLRDVASSLAILHSRGLVHRDVSSRNVRRTADGRAKLIDFGAMVSIGVAKDAVGTPPFMAPEALQKQTLDPRADLFSLGALAYHVLTGRHAYPARRMGELRDVWRSAPMPPQRIVPELPPALSSLVLQLIALDRGARPPSAAEVMNRLCAIADLPAEEHGAISRAYLTTPVLVGRDRELIAVRRRMLALARGDGGVLLAQGSQGSGRSRLLDACALDAKLLGATVVRADASDGARDAWGVVHTLGEQLFELMPRQAAEAARLSRDVLGHVFDGLRADASAVLPERSLLIRELRDFVLSLARSQRLVLVIDDADRIDEPSLALLVALALKVERHPLLLVLALGSGPERVESAPLSLLRSMGAPLELAALTEEQSDALLRSVFGDVPNLPLCAGRIHALAQGNPRTTMELAQHLVDRGLARYEGGRFSLPAQLDEGELPASLTASLQARLAQLSPDALELAQVLALCDGDAPALGRYADLTTHRDGKRVFAALDELCAARVLSLSAERYHFAQRGFVTVLRDSLDHERAAPHHARIADLLAQTGGGVLQRTHHLLEAGRDVEAIDLLSSINLLERLPPLPLLERALERAECLAQPARVIHQLRMAVLSKAPFVLAFDSFMRCAVPVLERLDRESGLWLYRELSHLPHPERLQQALTRTQMRYVSMPEHDRVFAVGDAIRELARLSGAFCSMAAATITIEVLELLPSLEPLRGLSPAIALVERLIESCRDWIAGHSERARDGYEGLLLRLGAPDRAGLDDAQHARTRLGMHYSLGLAAAMLGIDDAERHARALESDRELRVNAWRVRQILKLSQGDLEEARDCARRAELLQLQEGLEPRYLNTSAGIELTVCAAAGDLLGVENALKMVTQLAEHFPGWRAPQTVGRCRYLFLQGDPQAALDALLPNLDHARPGRNVFFCQMAALHVELLLALGRIDEAVPQAEHYLETARRVGLRGPDQMMEVAAALAYARAGEFDRAVQMMDPVIERAERMGRRGLAIGALYEVRARIAIWMNDREAFERYSERCATEFAKGRSAALAAKVTHLIEEARQHDVVPARLEPQLMNLVSITATEEYETVESRLRECVDAADRARCGLTLLLQAVESYAGFLYGLSDGELTLVAGLPERAPDRGVRAWIEEVARFELQSDGDATATDEDATVDGGSGRVGLRHVDTEGRTFEALPLSADGARGRRALVGVLAFAVETGAKNVPDRGLIEHVAAQLFAVRDAG